MAIDHHGHHHHEHAHHDVAYEKSDLGPRGIVTFFIFLGIAAVVIHLAILAMYKGFVAVSNRMQPDVSPLVQRAPAVSEGMIHNISKVNTEQFPEPRLQSDDVSDMNHFLSYEEQVLKAKPWSDPTGAVHLPIDIAMQAVVNKGLPTRANGTDPSKVDPMLVPSEAGFIGFSRGQQDADATMVPGAPMGDTEGPSKREEQMTIPGVNPSDKRNPSRPEPHPKGQEQPVKAPPTGGVGAGKPMNEGRR